MYLGWRQGERFKPQLADFLSDEAAAHCCSQTSKQRCTDGTVDIDCFKKSAFLDLTVLGFEAADLFHQHRADGLNDALQEVEVGLAD